MKIVKAQIEGKVIKDVALVDNEAYLRLGTPTGIGLASDGSYPTTCEPITYEAMPHNMKGKRKMSKKGMCY